MGTGKVGGTLGTGWADRGHSVMLGSRDPSQPRLAEWAAHDPEHRMVRDGRSAVLFGDVVVIAVPGRVLPEMLDAVGRDAFARKIVVDITNPFARDENGEWIDLWGDDFSGAEYLQREVPSASVVKAFNQIHYGHMLDPHNSPINRLRIAGDDERAKRVVGDLAREFGWRVRDLGPLTKARALEQAAVRIYG